MILANTFKKTAASAGLVGAIAITGMATLPATQADAMVCGYSQQLEEVEGAGVSISLGPISFILGGGQKQVAHWGNCGDGKTKIAVDTTKHGTVEHCVTPGDARLGPASGSDRVTGARAIGAC